MSTATDTAAETPPPPPDPPSRDNRIALVAALVGLGSAALFLVAAIAMVNRDTDSTDTDESADAFDDDGWGGVVVDPPYPRPEFTLTDTEGRPYDFAAETRGRLTMLYFGYTNCPDICPIHMATLSQALETPGTPEATVVFVTTDPERDTPERLRGWLDGFDPDIVGLTGTREEIAEAERAAQVAGSVLPPEATAGEDDYEVGHAGQIVAYTPDDQAHVVFPFGVRREDWISDLPRLLEQWG
jgi:protein SCO1/2